MFVSCVFTATKADERYEPSELRRHYRGKRRSLLCLFGVIDRQVGRSDDACHHIVVLCTEKRASMCTKNQKVSSVVVCITFRRTRADITVHHGANKFRNSNRFPPTTSSQNKSPSFVSRNEPTPSSLAHCDFKIRALKINPDQPLSPSQVASNPIIHPSYTVHPSTHPPSIHGQEARAELD